jgi:hypothetical protein
MVSDAGAVGRSIFPWLSGRAMLRNQYGEERA